MKKSLLLSFFVCCFLCVGCGKIGDDSNISDKQQRKIMVYELTRARFDVNREIIESYIPDVFIERRYKDRYILSLCNLKMKSSKGIGIQNIEYKICDAGIKENIFEQLGADYGVAEDMVNKAKKVGILEYDIKLSNEKIGYRTIHSENIAFLYEDEWTMFLISEVEKVQ